MQSTSKDVIISIWKQFVNMIVGKLAASAAMNLASPFTIPIGIAQLAAAGLVKGLGGSVAGLIAGAEHGMDSAPGGAVLVGEGGVEGAIYPGGQKGLVGLHGMEIRNLPSGTQIIPNDKINMSRFNTLPRFQEGGVVGGDTIDSSSSLVIENLNLTAEDPVDFGEQLQEFSESINTDIINQ